MRGLAITLAILSFAFAPHARAQTVEIIDHGIYTADKSNCTRDAQGIERCDRANMRLAVSTWDVPAQNGVEFGLRYRVTGVPKGKQITNLKRVWLLPPPGFRSPSSPQPVRTLDRPESVTAGQPVFATYGFDDDWERIAGPWVMEFWIGDKKVNEVTFNVTRP